MMENNKLLPLFVAIPIVLIIIALCGFFFKDFKFESTNKVEAHTELPTDTFREIVEEANTEEDVEEVEEIYDDRIVVDNTMSLDLSEMETSAFWRSLYQSRKRYAKQVYNLLTQYCTIHNIYVLSFESDMEEHTDGNGRYVVFTNGAKNVKIYEDEENEDYFIMKDER